ncbi:MAG: bifunctional adenosylcobinamide kinase/adenosylcobinamide-phosphate guanylyltransferase [Oscillibacter sp.]|nr:bifunctional adenosylcobinamide kinase/adenosylcobinamide-phosphate guanylyltransferase [Oscillibacter sp.]
MTILVSGSADSGKSAFAERLVCQLTPDVESGPRPSGENRPRPDFNRLYIAAMEPYGPEAAARIARHRVQREGLGFRTVERYTDLAGLTVPDSCTALVEDLGNLCANELFRRDTFQTGGDTFQTGGEAEAASLTASAVCLTEGAVRRAEGAVMEGVSHLRASCQHLVLVTNEVFLGGTGYAGDTDAWLRLLSRVNRRTAAISEAVCEIACGIPCWYRIPAGAGPPDRPLPAAFREGHRFREIILRQPESLVKTVHHRGG